MNHFWTQWSALDIVRGHCDYEVVSNCGSFWSQLGLIAMAVIGYLCILLNQHIGYEMYDRTLVYISWLLLHLYTFLINPQTAFKTLNLKMDDYLLLSAKQMKNMLYY